MMRSKSRCSDTSEQENEESLMEAELARLQRSYRVMQNDYKAYREETKRIVIKQNSLVDALQQEKEEIETCLNKMKTTQNINKDKNNADKLANLSEAEKHCQTLIREEREAIQQLDAQIAEVEKRIGEQRKVIGGLHTSTANHIAINKQTRVLENRLNKAVTHFNRQLAVNRSLREDIDHLRQEKALFDNLYKKLSKELDQCKGEMADIIESSTQAYEQRDEAQNKMQALKERTEKDQAQHDSEMKDLLRVIAHDNCIKEFMHIKASDRAELKAEEQAKKARKGGDGDQQMDADQEIIRMYEEAFSRIQEVTGETDVNTMISEFIKKEEENFALFHYVNELNAEVESHTEELSKIQKKIDDLRMEEEESELEREEIIKNMEAKHARLLKEKESAEKRLKEISKLMDQLLSGVETVFKSVGCDPKPILEMLGAEQGISEKNIMFYLGLIELKTNDMLNAVNYHDFKRQQSEQTGQPAPPPMLVPQKKVSFHVNVVPPNYGDESEEDEDEELLAPLSQTEIRRRAVRSLQPKATPEPQATPTKQVTTAKDTTRRKKNK